MKTPLTFFILMLLTVAANFAMAVPAKMTVSGRLVKPDGTALTSSAVTLAFSVTDPAGSCVIYKETSATLDLSNSDGNFDVVLGAGTVSYPTSPALTLKDVFNSTTAFNCSGSGTYTPGADDVRNLSIQFYDQTEASPTWRSFTSSIPLNSVGHSLYAESAKKLGDNVAADFLLTSLIPTCTAGTYLTWSGTALTCASVSGASGGTVTNVTSSNAYLSVATGTTTPALTLNVGTGANTVAAGDDSRITGALQSGAAAGGDLSGTLPNPSVAKVQGVSVSTTTPTAGQVLKYTGSAWAPSSLAVPDISGLAVACSVSETMYWNSVSGSFLCQSIDISAFVNGGNSFGVAANLGTKDANNLNLLVNNSARVTIDTSGNMGVGTASPTAKIEVQGGAIVANAQTSATACVNFLSGNVQVSSYSSTNNIKVGGMVDGGAYTLILTGYTAGQTVTVSAYTDASCSTAVSFGVDFGGSSSGVVNNFVAVGNTQVITLVYSASRGVVYGSAATNYYR